MTMRSSLFDEETVNALKEIFNNFPKKVVDYLIIDKTEAQHVHEHHHHEQGHSHRCPTCGEALLLAKELMRVSDGKLEFIILDENDDRARELKPRYIPAFIYGSPNKNVRLYGLPSGQEFAPFIYIHKYISTGELTLPKEVIDTVKEINTPLHIKIFVTPECPYCPLVVDAMNQMALANSNLLVETIEATELPLEADMYGVAYVPDIVITDPARMDGYGVEPIERINGYLPPDQMVEVLKAVAKKASSQKKFWGEA